VQSPDLSGGTVSRDVTCDGPGRAPSVGWTPSPHAVAAVVELLDPDAPGSTFVHWLAVADAVDAAAGVLHSPVVEGRNDFGRIGYGGPCPPGGQVHHYHLVVTTYAAALTLSSGFTATDLAGAVAGHAALGQGELVATYGR
jgi:Raf kinase inhibitor-like YbhB/YbcL family protein